MKILPTGLAVILLAGTSATWAQTTNGADHGFYIAPMASYDFFDENTFKPDDSLGAQLAIGKNLNRYFALEAYGFYFNDIDLKPSGNLDTFGLGLDLLAFPARHILPVFAILGGGFGRHNFNNVAADVNHQASDFYDLGVGVLIPITASGLALRGEYRYRRSSVDGPGQGNFEFRDNIVSLGLQIPLGGGDNTNEPFPRPAESPPQPESQPTVAAINHDNDNDGVLNKWDKCPNSQAHATVDLDGCTAAADAPLFVLDGVNFAYDSSSLSPLARKKLDYVVEALHGSPALRVRIEGYTDNVGGQAYNLPLSRQRANSVHSYLIERGIKPSRFQTVGYGESRPVAPNNTAENRAKNRRVELHTIRSK